MQDQLHKKHIRNLNQTLIDRIAKPKQFHSKVKNFNMLSYA